MFTFLTTTTAAAAAADATATTTATNSAAAAAEFSPTSFSWDFRHPVCTSIHVYTRIRLPIHMEAQYLFLAGDMIFLALYL